ncbi:MAG: dipeptide epimerase, partial [Pirellulaceae bacterium]|nr:dipeptide epimerase [Pirellulaceae bacterium]
CDLWGKLAGKPTYELLGLQLGETPLTNYTIGIDKVETMVAKMREFPDWPVYKVKLGADNDLEILRQLRSATDAAFRVDANCGWTVDQCLEYAGEMKQLGVEFIEQPLPADRWDDMKTLYAESPLPIVADESCILEEDVAKCAGHFHGVNVKLVKCGGVTPGLRMLREARSLGLKTMVGCMTESTVGISAIAQLLPLLDYVDMDGALLLAEDIATGVTIDQGRCIFPDKHGHGVELTSAGQLL